MQTIRCRYLMKEHVNRIFSTDSLDMLRPVSQRRSWVDGDDGGELGLQETIENLATNGMRNQAGILAYQSPDFYINKYK